ncbi:LacI family transcriptional regulator [Aggregatimonas sangjinii]|uniref:LacI family transcriptional regulator n=1 Tax=Aggregatimonas sangjinii TaxID=2583587 RepID=A0A5B7SJP0_9FLAO|nr:LacI family DNA-binding transcriptional regulator [Aggregatimonas sangjinii]QCW98646.1 LacI family transcriptional regulator [Aggregatimonas sangjinii]
MRKNITLKHIAKELEVSISTVSKALKNSEEIGKDTKEKVQAFAKLYNYRPNNIAISLKNRRTKTIGVIIPDIIHHFFTTVFRGIEKYANRHGYNVIICVSDESFDREVINMEMLANGSIDGFIMSLSAETQLKNDFNHLKEVTEQGIPLVLFDRVTDEVKCDKVIINDKEIAYKAVQMFIDEGKKRIALISTDDYLNVSAKRAIGYQEALRANNLEINESLVLILPYFGDSSNAISEFFDNNDFDAMLCVNEIFAVQCMREAQERGKRIPEDISVIGFTNGILSQYSSPRLTAIAQHGEQMGETAAQMLIERVEAELELDEDEENFRTEVIQATIINGGTTSNP